MPNKTRTINALALLATLAGCAGNGEGLDKNGLPLSSSSATSVLSADFNSIQDNVFTPVCATCHSGANAPRGLRLDAGNSYALLVGVASSEVPNLQRVRPGDPGASYLLQKIEGSAAVGQRMPLGGPYLPQATIEVIRQWIANGAQRSTAIATTRSLSLSGMPGLQVITTSPLAGETVKTLFTQIVIGFDREVDANLVNETTVALDKVDAGTAPIATRSMVASGNPSTLLVVPRSALSAGTYRLTLRGSGGGALAGLDALPLQAMEKSAAGSDYTLMFSIEVQP